MQLAIPARAFIAALLMIGGAVMADETRDRFPMVNVAPESDRVTFTFPDQPVLSASTAAPEGFVWDDLNEIPPEFMDAGVFSALENRYVGYDPLNRDRLEVRLYSGTLFPERVSTGAGHAMLLAARWGRVNFGVRTHDRDFGEVMAGDDSSGETIVNRIAVWRRGNDVLILRAKFAAAHYDAYETMIARLIGSLRFEEELGSDPIMKATTGGTLQPGKGHSSDPAAFDYRMPGNWELLVSGALDAPGDAAAWVDTDDPNRNSGAVVVALPAPSTAPPGGVPPPADDQPLIDVSATIAGIAVENLLPERAYELNPVEMSGDESLDEVAAFNRAFTYDATLDDGTRMGIIVQMVMTAEGVTLASATIGPAPSNLYLIGTRRHGDFVNALLFEDMKTHAVAADKRVR